MKPDEGERLSTLSLSNGLLKNLWKARIRYFDHNKDKGANAPGDLRRNQ
uniref:Uncharacterized protein n=1 Tax=Siphoviridae sp. ctKXi8 TaxID=2826244 RepID=A0A8S5MZI4_9CAUD|nr:MAG TPA: hypothetical protein [Siphoviridae sp. ctKXi8]